MVKRRTKLKDLKRINITITEEEYKWLSALAFAMETSISSEISGFISKARESDYGSAEIKKLKKGL